MDNNRSEYSYKIIVRDLPSEFPVIRLFDSNSALEGSFRIPSE
jgi:hypothetical protein